MDILHKREELDCLDYYSKIARKLERFLKDRELATKIILKDFRFLKRGSNSPKLFIEDLREVDCKMLSLRKHKLEEVKDKLTKKQQNIWRYFVPRKMVNFYYATNGESPGKDINRVFIDIDRGGFSSDDSRKAALNLIKIIKKDKDFNKRFKFKFLILWTGSSFHIYLDLNKKIRQADYEQYLSYGKKKGNSFIVKWAEVVSKDTGLKVVAGHEKRKDAIILDSSNTPSGKLARVPFSLHIKDYKEYDGVSVPVSEKELGDRKLIGKLKKLTPDLVLKDLNKYSKLLI